MKNMICKNLMTISPSLFDQNGHGLSLAVSHLSAAPFAGGCLS